MLAFEWYNQIDAGYARESAYAMTVILRRDEA